MPLPDIAALSDDDGEGVHHTPPPPPQPAPAPTLKRKGGPGTIQDARLTPGQIHSSLSKIVAQNCPCKKKGGGKSCFAAFRERPDLLRNLLELRLNLQKLHKDDVDQKVS